MNFIWKIINVLNLILEMMVIIYSFTIDFTVSCTCKELFGMDDEASIILSLIVIN